MIPEIEKFCIKRATFFLEKMSRLMKVSILDVLDRNDHFHLMCRAVVAHALHSEGYSDRIIGNAIGVDRTTIQSWRMKMQYRVEHPELDPEAMRIYSLFNVRKYDVYYRTNPRVVSLGESL